MFVVDLTVLSSALRKLSRSPTGSQSSGQWDARSWDARQTRIFRTLRGKLTMKF